MDTLLESLNEKQREAVITTDKPLLILAGPGSGKTKTLTHRIAHLISQGVLPEHILAVTFTNKAAKEMAERINRLIPNARHAMQTMFIGTFHSFAARMLRRHAQTIGFLPHFTIMDDDDSMSLVKEIMKERNINPKQFPAGLIAHTFSRLKNELVTPDRYEIEAGGELFPTTIHGVWREYQRQLRESNAMDFDDLLVHACTLLQDHPELLQTYQEQFHYIHVDEYQDVNHAQYILMRLLSSLHRTIAVVGDDAQAIYSFRGADFRNILQFEKDWPDAHVIILDQNYRSPQTILDAARAVISKNTVQKEKKLWTERRGGELIRVAPTANERHEAIFVTDTIHSLANEGVTRADCAVLYRTNAQSRVLEEALIDAKTPYRIVGGVGFYQRKEIKDITAYLRLIANPNDLLNLKRIINTPPRGIGKVALLNYLATSRGTTKDPKCQQFDALIEDLRSTSREIPPSSLIIKIIRVIQYKEYLAEATKNADERWENIEEYITLAKKYDQLPPDESIRTLLEDIALIAEDTRAASDSSDKNKVTLMTLHAAKGLEFPVVFIIGLEDGIFPHSRSLFNTAELEEERRLCYVGITRAKERLYLSFALQRNQYGSTMVNPPSRFIAEIPESCMIIEEAEPETILF